MDIEVVNTILQLCVEHDRCLFEVSFLFDYCLEQNLCSNFKYVLASIKNYMEIFKISRDQNRIEFVMPFEICRNPFLDGICDSRGEVCPNIHLCYDYFYTNACRRSSNCSYPHMLTEKYHEDILGPLISLDLETLTKAFRVYCQSNKHVVNHHSSRGQLSASLIKNPTPSSSVANNWRMGTTSQINGNSSWKINNRSVITTKTLPKQATIRQISEKGLQLSWQPQKDIQTHFIEVVFSNQGKSDGGPIRTHQIYQHFGVAQVFYHNSEIADRVVLHGPVTFQSFTFTPRLLQRTIDLRHICFSNLSIETNHIEFYLDTVSIPYRKVNYEYYQNDKNIIIVEYDEDIDFPKIYANVRNRPECDGFMINCIQLYLPEVLFIEYDQEYSEEDIRKWFEKDRIFHMKTYSYCSFVHFYSHDDLMQSLNKPSDDFIRVTPIYIDIYSQEHLNNYLKQRQMKIPSKSPITFPTSSETETLKNEPVQTQSSIPILPPPPIDQQTETITEKTSQTEPIIEEELNDSIEDSDEDDFHDLPSEFDDEDLCLDESVDNNGDMEFLRNAAKNLMSSLTEMEEASANTDTIDAPHSLLYADDYIVTIKSRRFALAFLDYTQFRVEKQRNPDRFRILASLRKLKNNKKRLDNCPQHDQPSITEPKTNKKKRNKRNKKKKTNEKDEETEPAT